MKLIRTKLLNLLNNNDEYNLYRCDGGNAEQEILLGKYKVKKTQKTLSFISEDEIEDCRVGNKINFKTEVEIKNGKARLNSTLIAIWDIKTIVIYPNREGIPYIFRKLSTV